MARLSLRALPVPAPAAVLLAVVAGCAPDAPPAVTAGDVAFASDEVLGLPHDRLVLLGELAVFGQAVADSALPALGRPLVEARATERLHDRLQARAALDSAGVGDEVLEARYRTAPELELTVRHLLVFSARYETEATRAAARAKAEAALARIRGGEPFPTVAADVSEEPGAESREGLLTPGREGSWVGEFWAAATALEPGEISPVVETQYGFHVLRLEARDTVPFAEARPRVAREVADLMGLRAGGLDQVPLPDGLPDAPAADRLADPTVADDAPVAEGDRWRVTLGDVRDALALLPEPERRRVGEDAAVRRRALEEAVRRAVVRALGADEGVALDDSDLAAIRREWVQQAEVWALQLGFGPGMGREEVRRAALAALAASGQNASLARDALRREAGGLIHRYAPIRVGETRPGSGA